MQSRPERLYRPLPQQKDGEMNRVEKAARFSELHVKGAPLLLYNAWDAGTAKSILDAGAKAIATSSWAVAEAQGYRDGESIPITFVEQIIARIVSTIDAPVSVDFEGGYSYGNGALAPCCTDQQLSEVSPARPLFMGGERTPAAPARACGSARPQ